MHRSHEHIDRFQASPLHLQRSMGCGNLTCDGTAFEPDPDIGGIGVRLAIQLL